MHGWFYERVAREGQTLIKLTNQLILILFSANCFRKNEGIYYLFIIFQEVRDEDRHCAFGVFFFILDSERIKVRFLNTIGHLDHDVSFVYSPNSLVEFICLCSDCSTVQLYILSTTESYQMKQRSLSDEWLLTMKLNDSLPLGEYQCWSDSVHFATYNWLYKLSPCKYLFSHYFKLYQLQ